MTHEDRGHYAKKHPSDRRLDPKIADAVRKQAPNQELSCAAAFQIAEEHHSLPAEVGTCADLLEITLVKCQLGLFGHSPEKRIVRPAESVPRELEDAIGSGLSRGRLSCKRAWEIADRFGIQKMRVSAASEALGIKISGCQLGAF
jgi:hypothetical protein